MTSPWLLARHALPSGRSDVALPRPPAPGTHRLHPGACRAHPSPRCAPLEFSASSDSRDGKQRWWLGWTEMEAVVAGLGGGGGHFMVEFWPDIGRTPVRNQGLESMVRTTMWGESGEFQPVFNMYSAPQTVYIRSEAREYMAHQNIYRSAHFYG
jgi:hypothetical protein